MEWFDDLVPYIPADMLEQPVDPGDIGVPLVPTTFEQQLIARNADLSSKLWHLKNALDSLHRENVELKNYNVALVAKLHRAGLAAEGPPPAHAASRFTGRLAGRLPSRLA